MELSKLRQKRQQCSNGDTNHTIHVAKATEVVAKENGDDVMSTEKPTVAKETKQQNKRSTNKTCSPDKKVVSTISNINIF